MQNLNKEFDGRLSLAITMFKGDYSRQFFGQLISSQLDMDRSDYLKRDSFYTGVSCWNHKCKYQHARRTLALEEAIV